MGVVHRVIPLLVGAAGCVLTPVAPVVEPGAGQPESRPDALVERQLTLGSSERSPAAEGRGPGAPKLTPDPVPFAIGAGYGALSHVDLDGCRGKGLPAGYVHLNATFTPAGYVVRASVASPTAPSPSALDCIADQLRLAGVPAFDGSEARLSRTYFVEPASAPEGPPQAPAAGPGAETTAVPAESAPPDSP
jgi:hypothetical protein